MSYYGLIKVTRILFAQILSYNLEASLPIIKMVLQGSQRIEKAELIPNPI